MLLSVGTIREILGKGTWFDITILPNAANGGWYVPNGLMVLPPSAFFVIGLLIWALRTWKPEQNEARDYVEAAAAKPIILGANH